MEVTFFDEDGYGWYAVMAFYSDEGLESQIFNPDFDGDGYYDYDGFPPALPW